MTTTQVVKTLVTTTSLSKDYLHPDDHAKQINCTLWSTLRKKDAAVMLNPFPPTPLTCPALSLDR